METPIRNLPNTIVTIANLKALRALNVGSLLGPSIHGNFLIRAVRLVSLTSRRRNWVTRSAAIESAGI